MVDGLQGRSVHIEVYDVPGSTILEMMVERRNNEAPAVFALMGRSGRKWNISLTLYLAVNGKVTLKRLYRTIQTDIQLSTLSSERTSTLQWRRCLWE